MKTKYIFGQMKAAPPGADYDQDFVCSTNCVDRDDEVIEQDGWMLAAFRSNPVFLAAHQHRLANGYSPVIGSFASVGIETLPDGRKALAGKVRFADTELGRDYRTLYHDGHMRAVSVGFMPLKSIMRPVDAAAPKGPQRRHLTENELWEVSAVAVPANAEALARLRAAGIVGEEDPSDPSDTTARLTAAVQTAVDYGIKSIQAAVLDRIDEFLACLPEYREAGSGGVDAEVAPGDDADPDATATRAAGGEPTNGAETVAKAARELAASLH